MENSRLSLSYREPEYWRPCLKRKRQERKKRRGGEEGRRGGEKRRGEGKTMGGGEQSNSKKPTSPRMSAQRSLGWALCPLPAVTLRRLLPFCN